VADAASAEDGEDCDSSPVSAFMHTNGCVGVSRCCIGALCAGAGGGGGEAQQHHVGTCATRAGARIVRASYGYQ